MVTEDMVLQHETRRMLYTYISAHPGVSFNELKKVFELADGTLRYHLDYLKRAERISNNIVEGRRVYFQNTPGEFVKALNGGDNGVNRLTTVQQRLINVIKRNPGISHNELSKKTRMNRIKIRSNVSMLMDMGMVRKINHKNTVCYECITDGNKEYQIMKILIIKFLTGEIDESTFVEMRNRLD